MNDYPPTGAPPNGPPPSYQPGYPPGPPQPGYSYGPPPQPGAGGPMYLQPQTSGYAIASMVLGITGFVALGIIGSILALVFANLAEKEIRASNGQLVGQGYVTAGRVMGWIGVALTALVVVILAVVVISFLVAAPHLSFPPLPTDTPTTP